MGNTEEVIELEKTDEEIRRAIIDYVTNNQVHAQDFLFEGVKEILPDEQLYRKRVIFCDMRKDGTLTYDGVSVNVR